MLMRFIANGPGERVTAKDFLSVQIFKEVGFVAAALLMLGGCSHDPALVGGPDVMVPQDNVLPAPDRSDMSAEERTYLIGPMDKLAIDVYGLSNLSKDEIQVDASGNISMPLVGTVHVGAMTPAEVETQLASRLGTVGVRNPSVSVNLKESVSQTVTVDGQVREPGMYQVNGRMSLLRAISVAKGGTEFANLKTVVILRTVKNQRMAAIYNVNSIRQGIYADPEVYPNDVVIVGESASRRALREFGALAPALLTPILYILTR